MSKPAQTSPSRSRQGAVPRPCRTRRIDHAPFGWLDARLLKNEWLKALSPEAVTVYVFLCLVANRQGVSWYRRARIEQALGLSESAVAKALRRLIELDLVAFQPFSPGAPDGFHQVLSLPDGGPPSLLPRLLELWNPPSP